MNYLHSDKIKILENKSDEIRKLMTSSLFGVERDCPASSFEAVSIFTFLFFHILKHNPKDPEWKERDRLLILSNDYICPALYSTMTHAGYLSIEDLKNLHKLGLHPQDHLRRKFLPGIEINSDLLGPALYQTVGMILADKINRRRPTDNFFYCFLGGKELRGGQDWEAIQMAGEKNLHNLIAIIDMDNILVDGSMKETESIETVTEKFEKGNWHVLNADRNDFDEMDEVITQAQSVFAKPTVIVMHNSK